MKIKSIKDMQILLANISRLKVSSNITLPLLGGEQRDIYNTLFFFFEEEFKLFNYSITKSKTFGCFSNYLIPLFLRTMAAFCYIS